MLKGDGHNIINITHNNSQKRTPSSTSFVRTHTGHTRRSTLTAGLQFHRKLAAHYNHKTTMFNEIKKYTKYLSGKKSEAADLEIKDALLAKTIFDIHRKRKHSEFIVVPLFTLQPIHAIDRANAIKATENRVKVLEMAKIVLLQKKNLTRKVLEEYLPSVSGIKVVKNSDNFYISYEGNGRLVAMQKVFSPSDSINVEVEEYYFTNPAKILRRMVRIRRLNGLLD